VDTPERIERVSLHPSLSIAEDYGRITINDVWYKYEPETDSLIRCTTIQPPQAALFEIEEHEQQL